MEIIDNCSNTISATSPEFEKLVRTIVAAEKSKNERYNMSVEDFKRWVHDTVRVIFDGMGIVIQHFEEFWKDVGQSLQFFGEDIVEGFNSGRDRVRKQHEKRRELARLEREKQALLRKIARSE